MDSEKSDVGKRVKDQVFATIALKKGASSKNEVSCVTYYTVLHTILFNVNHIIKFQATGYKVAQWKNGFIKIAQCSKFEFSLHKTES